MAMQSGKSTLFQKLGAKLVEAHEQHKFDQPNVGDMGLPAGIENGIAQLDEVSFKVIPEGKPNAGKDRFYMSGTVKLPVEHGGVPTQGLRTFVTEDLFDTPSARDRKTISDHLGYIYQHYLLPFGVDVANLDVRDLEAVCAELADAKPHFRFRTWKGQRQSKEAIIAANPGMAPSRAEELSKREPMVNHVWGAMVDYEDPDPYASGNGVQVDEPRSTAHQAVQQRSSSSAAQPAGKVRMEPLPVRVGNSVKGNGEGSPGREDQPSGQTAQRSRSAPATSSQEGSPDGEAVQGNPSADADGALTELANLAAQGDEESIFRLVEIGESVGISRAQIEASEDPTWMEVVEMIKQGGLAVQGQSAPDPEPEAAPLPKKGEVWNYHPIDFRSKQPSAKAVRVEVLSVDEARGTCNLKNLDNAKSPGYKGIPLVALS